ncbi:helix-turn-helix transcriptional regulator [Streptomyces sp. NPDC003832]
MSVCCEASMNAPPPPSSRAGPLVGRDQDLQMIASLLPGKAEGGSALLLRGDPGVGKTALLDAAAGQADQAGILALRVSGVEGEADMAFAGLHQMLAPLHRAVVRLPSAQRQAIERALGIVGGPVPDTFALSSATMAVLSAVADERPLLLIADDIAWMDRASTEVLSFVARRLGPLTPVTLLAALRTTDPYPLDLEKLPQHRIAPLDAEAAQQLLTSRFPALAAHTRQRLLAEAEGNPLALLELPASLTPAQVAGEEPLPTGLPLTTRMEAVFAGRARRLAKPVRDLLLMAALDTTSPTPSSRPAGPLAQADDEHLRQAVQAGLVDFAGDVPRLRHPLARSAVIQMASPAERREAHERLAEAFAEDADRRAWHLAGAAREPDETVAAALEHAARRAVQKAGAASAVTAFARAAELSPDPAQRARRLTEAAYAASQTGYVDYAQHLLTDARQAHSSPHDAARGARTAAAYLLLHCEGDLDAAHRQLIWALNSSEDPSAPNTIGLDETLYVLLFVCYFGSRPELWQQLDAAIARPDLTLAPVTQLYVDAITDPENTADSARARLEQLITQTPEDVEPWSITRIGFAAHQVGALNLCKDRLYRLLERERTDGAVSSRLTAIVLLAIEEIISGQWSRADALAHDGHALARAHGYQLLACLMQCQMAWVAALRGQSERTTAIARSIEEWAAPRGIELTRAAALHARAIAALGDRDFELAYRLLARLAPPGQLPRRNHFVPASVMDFVEAALRTGHTEQAHAHLKAARRLGTDRISPRMALITAGAVALTAPAQQADSLFQAALRLDPTGRYPFEQARIQLAHGCWLRRTRDLARARLCLNDAQEAFERLGAAAWAAIATDELRAAGGTVTARSAPAAGTLTAQELQIAQLAASGLTNRQIGERMQLSPRTVGTHLYNVFPKLRITTRAALRDALEHLGAATEPAQQDR